MVEIQSERRTRILLSRLWWIVGAGILVWFPVHLGVLILDMLVLDRFYGCEFKNVSEAILRGAAIDHLGTYRYVVLMDAGWFVAIWLSMRWLGYVSDAMFYACGLYLVSFACYAAWPVSVILSCGEEYGLSDPLTTPMSILAWGAVPALFLASTIFLLGLAVTQKHHLEV
ncbi:MAG: hypothetical protein AAGE80_03955 [Pseudomonadota bacterium]